MKKYSKPLDSTGWSEHYNINKLERVVNDIQTGNVSIWTKELCKIIPEDAKCLEIGCGSGNSSLWLAKKGRNVVALDYTESSVELVSVAAQQMNISIETICADATRELPFNDNEFDVIFQCGLLEHFSTEEQIELLKMWKKYSKKMISMIPNAASVPYRIGKQLMEEAGTWTYGLEIPKHSMASEFVQAGIELQSEYTIGTEWALKFLPERHYIKKYFCKLMKQGINLDDIMQGYLLVTVGACE